MVGSDGKGVPIVLWSSADPLYLFLQKGNLQLAEDRIEPVCVSPVDRPAVVPPEPAHVDEFSILLKTGGQLVGISVIPGVDPRGEQCDRGGVPGHSRTHWVKDKWVETLIYLLEILRSASLLAHRLVGIR